MTCQGCGAPVEQPPHGGRRRKWCSERCRKVTLYTGTCADCGKPTGWNGTAIPSERCIPCASKLRTRWTHDTILRAIRQWAAEHGRPPQATDWNSTAARAAGRPPRGTEYPPVFKVQTVFGSWANAIEAAGFERPRPGPRPKLVAA